MKSDFKNRQTTRMVSKDTVQCTCPDMMVERVRGVATPNAGKGWSAWVMRHGPGTDCAKSGPVTVESYHESGPLVDRKAALKWLEKECA
jgi:hypothetical protein